MDNLTELKCVLEQTRQHIKTLERQIEEEERNIHVDRIHELFKHITGSHGYPIEISLLPNDKIEVKTSEYVWGDSSVRQFLSEYRVEYFEFNRTIPFIKFVVTPILQAGW